MRSRTRLQRAIALAVTSAAALTGCDLNPFGDDGVESDAERFCGEAVAQRDMILAPPMSTDAELEATLDF